MQQLLMETLHAARQHFNGKRVRVWYIKLDESAWKAIVIDPVTKIKLTEGPIKKTARGSVSSLRNQMKKAVPKKTSSS